MRQSDKKYLDSLVVKLQAMHQPQTECPAHELSFDEDDFQRIFGVGDEQQKKPSSIYTDWDNSGHGRRNFE